MKTIVPDEVNTVHSEVMSPMVFIAVSASGVSGGMTWSKFDGALVFDLDGTESPDGLYISAISSHP